MTAAEKILQKALVASGLDSSQWNRVQAGLRDRAFFSSQVASARILHALREQVAEATEGVKSDSEIRRDIREYLSKAGYNPGDARGTIKDLFTKSRLDVIIDTNRRQARGFAQHMEATTNGALRAFPAYELVRVYERKQKRDWISRWTAAGGKVYPGNRMIALKTDPIWTRISAFGSPYPPFDWGSGMGVEDVGRGECLDLGVIDDDTPEQTPPTADFNSGMRADVADNDSEMRGKLVEAFGDQVRFENGHVMWRSEVLRESFRTKDFKIVLGQSQRGMLEKLSKQDNMKEFAREILGERLELTQEWRDIKRPDGSDHLSHFEYDPKKPNNIPLTEDDLDMLPSLWRNPDCVVKLTGERFQSEIDAFDGTTYCLQIAIKDKDGKKLEHPRVWTFFKTTKPLSKRIGLR